MQYFRDLYKNFPYNWYGKSIQDVFEIPFEHGAGSEDLNTEYGEGTLKFSETKREIEISFQPVNSSYGAENIFAGNISWKIMKLTKTGQLKLQAKYNSKLYEIEFN